MLTSAAAHLSIYWRGDELIELPSTSHDFGFTSPSRVLGRFPTWGSRALHEFPTESRLMDYEHIIRVISHLSIQGSRALHECGVFSDFKSFWHCILCNQATELHLFQIVTLFFFRLFLQHSSAKSFSPIRSRTVRPVDVESVQVGGTCSCLHVTYSYLATTQREVSIVPEHESLHQPS